MELLLFSQCFQEFKRSFLSEYQSFSCVACVFFHHEHAALSALTVGNAWLLVKCQPGLEPLTLEQQEAGACPGRQTSRLR